MSQSKVRILSSELIFKGNLLRLKLDRISLPGNRTTTREYVEFGRSVVIVPVLDRDRVVLVRQYRHPTRAELLELPAGKVEEQEKPEHAALRELQEETGFIAGEIRPIGEFYLSPGYSGELMSGFVANRLRAGDKNPDPDEILETVIMSKPEVARCLAENRFKDAKTILGLLWWLRQSGG